MQRATLVSRFAVAGLLCVFFVLTGIAVWGTTTTQRAAQETEATVLLSDDYQNAAREVQREATVEGAYRFSPTAVAVAAQWTAADATVDALVKIEADGDLDDRSIAQRCLRDHASYQDAINFLFAAVDAGDTGFAASVDVHNVKPFFDVIARSVEGRRDTLHRRALQSLATLTQTQLTVQRTTLTALTIGLCFLGVFALILRTYQHRLADALDAQISRLSRAALTDNLTRLGNHRAFEDVLARSIHRAVQTGNPLTLAMVDVDEFKVINDRNGHAFGDRVLSMLGTLLGDIRADDMLSAYRIGGDEFAIIFADVALLDALAIIARFRDACAAQHFDATLSIGLAALPHEAADMAQIKADADAALYEAKRRGRNTVVAFDQIDQNISR